MNKSNLTHILRRFPIGIRFVSIYFFTSLIPITLICLVGTLIFTQTIESQINKYANQTLAIIDDNLSILLDDQVSFSYQFLVNDIIQDSLHTPSTSIDMTSVFQELDPSYNWLTICENIMVTDLDGTISGSLASSHPPTSFFSDSISFWDTSDTTHFWTNTTSLSGRDLIVLNKKIYSKIHRGEHIGYLHLIFNEQRMFKNIYKHFDNNEFNFIIDHNLNYVSSKTDSHKIGLPLEIDNLDNQFFQKTSGSFISLYNNTECIINYKKNPTTGWYIFSATPVSQLFYIITHIQNLVLSSGIILLAFTTLIMFIISQTIVKPIHKLSHYMHLIATGYYTDTPDDTSQDELGILTRDCTNTVSKLLILLNDVEEKNKKQRKLELQVLQSQINPHFLFNTLNTFQYIAMINNMPTLDSGLQAFSNLLRQTILGEDELICLADEVKNIDNYLIIQKFKYAGMFHIDYDLDPQTLDYKVPRLMLQPIVENSLIHGIIPGHRLNLKLKSYYENHFIVIIISDNGKGFIPDQLHERPKNTFSGIGINNTQERIRLRYGSDSSYILRSVPNLGTTITIKLPIISSKEAL